MFANPRGLQTLSERKQADATINRTIPLLTLTGDDPKHEQVHVEIENVVATVDLNQDLNLEGILEVTPGAKYNPQGFPGLVYKLMRPRTTILIFTSGKMVCTGAKIEADINLAIEKLHDTLQLNKLITCNTSKEESSTLLLNETPIIQE
jgi:transcription initiation factor TFIID TATA-box-binding protein